MTRRDFLDSMFEIADLWTVGADVNDYCDFLSFL